MSDKQRGFTLVELVAVIVILGILATATTQYIIFGSQIYVESTERQRVLSQSRFLVERLTRELRTALPNSIRPYNSGNCIEFVPIKTSGAYRTDNLATLAPISPNSAASTIDVVSWDVQNSDENDRIYIYATAPGQIYSQTNVTNEQDRWGRILSVTGTQPEYTLTFKQQVADNSASNELFPEESPISRFYTADHSVNFCLTGGSVFRFIKTDFDPSPSLTVPSGAVLMAEGLTNSTQVPFNYTASQQRNSVVSLYLEFSANAGENMFFNHEVHIPNVP